MRSLIVGFGHAGRDLHLRCLKKAWARCRDEDMFDQSVGVVETRALQAGFLGTLGVHLFQAMDDVRGFDPEVTVVHVCTPPESHLEALKEAVDRGYRKLLVEKPLATTRRELAEILDLARAHELDVQVAAPWLSSSLSARLGALVRSGRFGRLLDLRVEQHKPRFTRTLTQPSHPTAFEVEMPHEVALALHLGGLDAEMVGATTTPMVVAGVTIPHMGSAEVRLRHANRVRSLLQSDLTATMRMRSVTLRFADRSVFGYYPASADDHYSRLTVTDALGGALASELVEDDPMTTWLRDCYRYFVGQGPRPPCDLRFAASVVSILCEAKELCGAVERDRDLAPNG